MQENSNQIIHKEIFLLSDILLLCTERGLLANLCPIYYTTAPAADHASDDDASDAGDADDTSDDDWEKFQIKTFPQHLLGSPPPSSSSVGRKDHMLPGERLILKTIGRINMQ